MQNVRVWFKKKGSARYISHLDLMRCMSRAVKLSLLPVWYTEGFNPRIYMTFAMPLSLGMNGENECMDIRLTDEVPFDEIVSRLNERLPGDIEVFSAAAPVHDFKEIAYADYELTLEDDSPDRLLESVTALFGRESIVAVKHGKKGDRETDIKPGIISFNAEKDGAGRLKLSLRLPCSMDGSVNPSLVPEALKRYEGVEPYSVIVRKSLLLKDFSELQ